MPIRLIASAVLTAMLALVALPGLAGSHAPSPERIVPAVVFQALGIDASVDPSSLTIGPLDAARRSASYLDPAAPLVEPAAYRAPAGRPKAKAPRPKVAYAYKPARFELSGMATWYSNGTTAMRLPRGTRVVVCGPGGCVERTVTDYGPGKPSRVVDLAPGDFVRVCGCRLWRGTTRVTVRIY